MATATVTTSARPVTVKVSPAEGRPTVFKFSECRPGSRAARWLRKHHPIGEVIDERAAELVGGGRVEVITGGTVLGLYGSGEPAATVVPPVPVPQPEPAPEAGPKKRVDRKSKIARKGKKG